MKSHILQWLKGTALVALSVFFLTSCFEESLVVKVAPDGSGVVHVRSYNNVGAAAGLLGGLGGDADGGEVIEEPLPDEAELIAQAETMGEGVTFKEVARGQNAKGWKGHEIIWEFEDVNTLKVDMNALGSSMGEDIGDAAGEDLGIEEEEPQYITFEMADGVLQVHTPAAIDISEGEDMEQMEDPQAAAMFGQMMAGARMGMFVEADGTITDSNALHQNGNMVTIMLMEFDKFMGGMAANAAAMKGLSEVDPNDRAAIQEAVEGINGLTVDLQDPITLTIE